ncbi:MAG: hydroxyacid dehydrogenase [Planctomycetes bacterium]|nr:hydroxyacid dehydrogenase [Planctomycetota bacterium]
MRHRVAVLPPTGLAARLFSSADAARLDADYDVARNPSAENLSAAEAVSIVGDAEAVVTGWGSPRFAGDLLEAAGRLKLLVHGAGTVKPFVSDELFARGIRVSSSASCIAEDVAVTALGYIICGLKNAFGLTAVLREGGWGPRDERVRDVYNKTVGVIGASRVGRAALKLLRALPVNILLYDPLVDDNEAGRLGAAKCSLEKLLQESDVVTVHAPAIDATRKMLNADNMKLMKDNVLLVNTARGMIIDEGALVDFLETRPVAAAVLDVTDPEPPADNSPLRRTSNCYLTPHVAGSTESGLNRIGNHIISEMDSFFESGELCEEVTAEMLERIA